MHLKYTNVHIDDSPPSVSSTLFPSIFLRRQFYFPRLFRGIRLLFSEERSSSSRKSQFLLCLDEIRAASHVRGTELQHV